MWILCQIPGTINRDRSLHTMPHQPFSPLPVFLLSRSSALYLFRAMLLSYSRAVVQLFYLQILFNKVGHPCIQMIRGVASVDAMVFIRIELHLKLFIGLHQLF